MRQSTLLRCLASIWLLAWGAVQAQVTAYTDEAAFQTDIAGLGYGWLLEEFEDDVPWGGVRVPNTAPLVRARDVSWSANNPDSEVTTGGGAASSGDWGLFELPHGSYATGAGCQLPENCGDGIAGSSEMTLYAVGGWFDTNTPFAKIGLFIGGYPQNPVDFGETCPPGVGDCSDNAVIGTQPRFFGAIDPKGFQRFEFRELEGTRDDVKYIFADRFSIVTACPGWICPAGISTGWRATLGRPGN